MKINRKINKITIILLITVICILVGYRLTRHNYKETQKPQDEIDKKINDEIVIRYNVYNNDNPSIRLVVYSEIGINEIIYPDGQIGNYNNKKKVETFYSIDKNGEYLFTIKDSNGKVIEKLIEVNEIDEKVVDNNNETIDENNNTSNIFETNNVNIKNNKPSNSQKTNNSNQNNTNNNQTTTNNSNNENKPLKEDRVIGTIYFNKPVGWTNAYLYATNNNGSVVGDFPGNTGRVVDGNIIAFDIYESMGNTNTLMLQFNNGKYYKTETINYSGSNKLYNITTLALSAGYNTGEWIDFDEATISVGGPYNSSKIKNVIFMIGDGMGVSHVKAGELYKGSNLVFSNFFNTYVSTYSKSDFVTDSAASATALATGEKTINYYVGISYYGNELETLAEYSHKKGLKTGLVVTQMVNHATPAAFSAHSYNRSNYEEITVDQINSGIDLMLGGGSTYFDTDDMKSLMNQNNYRYITNFSDIYNIDNNEKVIGTFAPSSFHETSGTPNLRTMTEVALNRLGSNDNGFFLMVEGSNIDSYSHNNNLIGMLNELIEFDQAILASKNYVDNHPDTLLVVTADHETGGLNLNGSYDYDSLLNQAVFTSSPGSSKPHTAAFVKVYTYGKGASGLTYPSLIDNTYIHNYIKQGLINTYGY